MDKPWLSFPSVYGKSCIYFSSLLHYVPSPFLSLHPSPTPPPTPLSISALSHLFSEESVYTNLTSLSKEDVSV